MTDRNETWVELSESVYDMVLAIRDCHINHGHSRTTAKLVIREAVKYQYDFLVEAKLIAKPAKKGGRNGR